MVSPCFSEASSTPAAKVLDPLGCTSTLVFCTSSLARTGPEEDVPVDEPVDEDELLGVVVVVVDVPFFSAAVAPFALERERDRAERENGDEAMDESRPSWHVPPSVRGSAARTWSVRGEIT